VNLVGSYAFDQGPLKGTRVGGSARWREAPTIGYPERAGTFDVANAFSGKDSLVTDAFVSYAWRQKLLDRNMNWTVSFRVRNLLDDDGAYPASAVDTGSGQAHILQRIYQAPRSYELSAGLKF
jgi:outer membrane receptor protein involved in Fe transport